MDVGIINAVQHHVHGRDTQHGGVKIEAVEHVVADMGPMILEQVAGEGLLGLAGVRIRFLHHRLGRGVVFEKVVHRLDQKAAGAT